MLIAGLLGLAMAFWRHILAIGAFLVLSWAVMSFVWAPFADIRDGRLQVWDSAYISQPSGIELTFTARNMTSDKVIDQIRFTCGYMGSSLYVGSIKPGETIHGSVFLRGTYRDRPDVRAKACKKSFSMRGVK